MGTSENRHGAIWVRGSDLERLFSARRICYLVGSYDGSGNYGDILQLHANVERLRAAGDDILAAPMVYWKFAPDHGALDDRHPWLFGDSCFLYYVPAHELDDAAAAIGDGQLVAVEYPPQAFSQMIIYGGGFLNSWWGWGAHKLNLIDLIASWLGEASPASHPLAIVGQQISKNFLASPDGDRFAAMLDHASMIGVRDALSLEHLKQWDHAECVNNPVVSGDDATLPIVAARDERIPGVGAVRETADAPVVNLHLNLENYVTDAPYKLLKRFEAIVRGLRRTAGDTLTLNLLVAYDDSRITETRYIDQLKAAPAVQGCKVNVVSCLDEVHQHYPNIGRAQLTVSCSYHVALTSLLLGIPTAFVHANEYYWHKAEGLKRAFHLPDAMFFDVQNGSPDAFAAALARVLGEEAYRAQLRERAARGAASMALRSAAISLTLAKFLTANYAANRDERYQATATRLLDATAQLSDLRMEYGRLLNTATKLSRARWERPRSGQLADSEYGRTIRGVRSAARERLPTGAKVLVVSRGDDELLRLTGRTGWHFPQTPSGMYAGHHPADSKAAVQHLTNLISNGAEYLVFPSTAFWWLDHYGGLKQHLNRNHREIWNDRHSIIYQLSGARARPAAGPAKVRPRPARAAAAPNGARGEQMAKDPIIVYGPPRSGTSYLIHILNKHPHIFITPETRVFVWAHRTLIEETQEFFSVFKHRERFIAYLQGKYPDLIRNYYRELNPDVRHWGDKNPHYASLDSDGCLQTVVDLFPGARFINIIRDGRGNVVSMLKKQWADFEGAHRSWIGHVDTGCAFGRQLPSEQYFELRYEDLIQDDTAMAQRIFDFLEIEIHPSVVKFCDAQQKKRSPINWPERDLSRDLSSSDWDTLLTPEQQLRSLDLLGERLIRHGYETQASLDEIRSGLLQSSSSRPGLASSVRGVVRALPALPVGGNGAALRIKRGKD